jgi:ADP-ribose pyrophosphatase YjhB (NUDIX family)
MMKLNQQLARWADQLRAMASHGLHYAPTTYDTERYQKIFEIAMAMLGRATGQDVDTFEPLHASAFRMSTPMSVGDAAVMDDQGRILLIRRADNKLWAMPGGGFEVGETPAEGAVREAREETGVICEATALVGVFDSRLCSPELPFHMYQFVFLCRPLPDEPTVPLVHPTEVLDVQWFAEVDLPADLEPGHAIRIPVAFRIWRGEQAAHFDPISHHP